MKNHFVLFDLDGTITDSSEGIINSIQCALNKMGLHENDKEKLEKLGETFHVKADARDILLYESATVGQEAKDLAQSTGVKQNLEESTLLGKWGQSIHHQLPDKNIIDRVKKFHDSYQHFKNT